MKLIGSLAVFSVSPPVKNPDAAPVLSPAPPIIAARPDSAPKPTPPAPSSTPVQVRWVQAIIFLSCKIFV